MKQFLGSDTLIAPIRGAGHFELLYTRAILVRTP